MKALITTALMGAIVIGAPAAPDFAQNATTPSTCCDCSACDCECC